MRLQCNKCGCKRMDNNPPTLATQINSYCPNCREIVLHTTYWDMEVYDDLEKT